MSKKYIYVSTVDDETPMVGLSYDPPLDSDIEKIEDGLLTIIEIDDTFADGESEVKVVTGMDEKDLVDPDAVVIDQFADLDPFHVITKNPEYYS